MRTRCFKKLILSSTLGLILLNGPLASTKASAAPQCSDLFRIKSAWDIVHDEIYPPENSFDYYNDADYLRAFKKMSDGIVTSRFDKRFNTRFYFAGTGVPGRDGKIPMIDPQAKAVYIFFHGSGTMKASGRVFKGLMNTLGNMGYAAVSFDMPFHMEGPYRERFDDPEYFMRWIHSIVEEIKAQAPGKPIYFSGHSFGPNAIAEYLYRYPFSAQGAALLSPAGFNQTLVDWIYNHTIYMHLGDDVYPNTAGGMWAARVASRFLWNHSDGKNDPTLRNPGLKVRVLTGNREEYAPAPLGQNKKPNGPNTYDIGEAMRQHLKNITVTVEDGIGHYIFDHTDANGRNAILRELLALDGVDGLPKIIQTITKEFQARPRTRAEEVWSKYATDILFRSWVKETYLERTLRKAVENQDERVLKKITTEYELAREVRERKLRERVLRLAETDPVFYARYQRTIDLMRSGEKKNDSSILSALADYLEGSASLE